MQEAKIKKKSGSSQRNSNVDEYPGLSDYTLIKVLGSGSFGKVYKAEKKDSKKNCAIKVINEKNLKFCFLDYRKKQCKES